MRAKRVCSGVGRTAAALKSDDRGPEPGTLSQAASDVRRMAPAVPKAIPNEDLPPALGLKAFPYHASCATVAEVPVAAHPPSFHCACPSQCWPNVTRKGSPTREGCDGQIYSPRIRRLLLPLQPGCDVTIGSSERRTTVKMYQPPRRRYRIHDCIYRRQ